MKKALKEYPMKLSYSHDPFSLLRMRQNTWERLLLFTGDTLGSSLQKLLSSSFISPVLHKEYYSALNRRLRTVFATAELCFHKYGKKNVLIDDGYR